MRLLLRTDRGSAGNSALSRSMWVSLVLFGTSTWCYHRQLWCFAWAGLPTALTFLSVTQSQSRRWPGSGPYIRSPPRPQKTQARQAPQSPAQPAARTAWPAHVRAPSAPHAARSAAAPCALRLPATRRGVPACVCMRSSCKLVATSAVLAPLSAPSSYT